MVRLPVGAGNDNKGPAMTERSRYVMPDLLGHLKKGKCPLLQPIDFQWALS